MAASWTTPPDDEDYYRLLSVVSILVGLETLVVPILMKLRRGNGPVREALILEQIEGDLYKDSVGKVYTVQAINTEQDRTTDADTPER